MELVAQFTRCAECGLTLLEEEAVQFVEGEWYHEWCALFGSLEPAELAALERRIIALEPSDAEE